MDIIKSIGTGTLTAIFLLTPSDCTRETNIAEKYTICYRVIDGDTFVTSENEHVRLIGINTPERGQPYAKEATEQLKKYILGAVIELEKDKGNKDKYERLLRYVWKDVNGDNVTDLVNELIVRDGYALAKAYPPNTKYQDRFEAAELEAKLNKRGIWQNGNNRRGR